MSLKGSTLEKVNFINCKISSGTYLSFVDEILRLGAARQSSYVCVMNVHMLVEAHSDPVFAGVVDNADVVTPDGMPLVVGMNKLYKSKQQRVAGMDLMHSLLECAHENSQSVYFFGSTDEVLQAIITRSKKDYPGLMIAGSFSPPFRPLTAVEEQDIVDDINQSNANLVFVALGCPKQEKWMAAMKGRVNAAMVGLGGAFPVFAGLQSRAPMWMQKNSLEWLYRLCQEPGRLWKRYFVTNSIFIALYLKEYIKVRALKRVP